MKMINRNIVLIGMPGCGKSTIGRRLAEKLKMNFCDVDEYIEKKEGMPIPKIFLKGEEYFRKVERISIIELSEIFPQVISTGGGVVLNYNNIKALRKNGIIIFINRPLEKIISDLDISGRPLLKDGKERIYRLYEQRINLYKNYCDIEVLNDGEIEKTLEDITRQIDSIP